MPSSDSVGDTPERIWQEVDAYALGLLAGADPVLETVLEESDREGLPDISVSPMQGRMLEVIARLVGARNILEVGTLGGFSTICLARALRPGGAVTTLEISQAHADVAVRNIEMAGYADSVRIEVGPAVDSLQRLIAEGRGPFDLVFIDADKPNIPRYFELALALARPGSAIIVDNVVREGKLLDSSGADPAVVGVRRVHELLKSDDRVTAATVQTVGSKGWDGFLLAVVNG